MNQAQNFSTATVCVRTRTAQAIADVATTNSRLWHNLCNQRISYQARHKQRKSFATMVPFKIIKGGLSASESSVAKNQPSQPKFVSRDYRRELGDRILARHIADRDAYLLKKRQQQNK